MKSLKWSVCPVCKEKYPKSSAQVTRNCVHGSRCTDFSAINNKDPGPVPVELQGLTFVEEQLISRIHPLIAVFKLKGLQYGSTGNVINFPQAVGEFARELPNCVEDLSFVIAVRFEHEKVEPREFYVRVAKVRNALLWLKDNNPFYADVTISEENLRQLPEGGNIYEHLRSYIISGENDSSSDKEDDSEDVEYSTVPVTVTPNQDSQIKSHLNWPSIGTNPVNEFKTPGYVACAFPTLFLTGKADLRSHRLKAVTPSSYFKHLMHYEDDRFNKHKTFRFFSTFALNSTMRWNALTDGHIFVKKNEEFENITVQELKDRLPDNPNLMKKIMFQGSNLRGTKSYWHARCGELKDMIEQLSLPTLFITLSAADLHWPDLFRLLTDKDPSDTSEKERRTLLQENPMICDQFCDERIQSFIKNVSILEQHWPLLAVKYDVQICRPAEIRKHGMIRECF